MNTILLYKDGNEFCALLGENLQDGYAGFAKTIPEALRALAQELEEGGVTEEIESLIA
jgi:hypothetical protein